MNIEELIKKNENKLSDRFANAEEIAYHNQCKVMEAFRKNKIALRHFVQTTGYGYGDEGRDALNALFADAFGAEAALVSPNIVSGTRIDGRAFRRFESGRYALFHFGCAL